MADFDEMVRTEAYLIWEAEGRPHGQHDRHWQAALARVREKVTAKVGAPVIPLPLKRVMLSARMKRRPQETAPLRASA